MRVTSRLSAAPPAGAGVYRSVNPARIKEIVAEVDLGDAATFVAACTAARSAQPGWADVPAPVRGRAIGHAGRVVEANAEAVARLVTAEVGQPYGGAVGEVREIIGPCYF